MVIDPHKSYEAVWAMCPSTKAEILTQCASGDYPLLARVHTIGQPVGLRFTSDGTAEAGYGVLYLKERVPYEDWPLDAEIYVWDHFADEALQRHFAGISKDGRPLAWEDGVTSWSTGDGDKLVWNYAKLREQKNETDKSGC